jgi:hypothetical protein
MEPEKNIEGTKKKGTIDGIADKLIDKAEDFIDEAADKIYNSEPYQKTVKTMEKATVGIFRIAGKWWEKLQYPLRCEFVIRISAIG